MHKSVTSSEFLTFICLTYICTNLSVGANQIETCHANLFLESKTGDYTHNMLYGTDELNLDVNLNAVKEEVQLFDWDELLHDITPVLKECQKGKVRPFCENK